MRIIESVCQASLYIASIQAGQLSKSGIADHDVSLYDYDMKSLPNTGGAYAPTEFRNNCSRISLTSVLCSWGRKHT